MQVSSYVTQQDATHTSTLIRLNDDELFKQSPKEEDNINMQFMSNETVIFKDGKDINWEVTYLGSICLIKY
jgi:hypothetical protein